MSATERDEKVELFDPKSSDSEDNCQTDEEVISEESFSMSLTKFKDIMNKNNHVDSGIKKNSTKSQRCSLTVSLRCRKFNRQFKTKVKSTKMSKKKKCKKLPEGNKICLEKSVEIPKKGKRCSLGGKAKGNSHEEEGLDKRDSDDDSDNFYFGRISLGYFQKFKDKSGASTSYQCEEDYKNTVSLCNEKDIMHKTSEEMELQELQEWGKTALVSSYNRKADDFDGEVIKPDRF